jgi:hypothetical protein
MFFNFPRVGNYAEVTIVRALSTGIAPEQHKEYENCAF